MTLSNKKREFYPDDYNEMCGDGYYEEDVRQAVIELKSIIQIRHIEGKYTSLSDYFRDIDTIFGQELTRETDSENYLLQSDSIPPKVESRPETTPHEARSGNSTSEPTGQPDAGETRKGCGKRWLPRLPQIKICGIDILCEECAK